MSIKVFLSYVYEDGAAYVHQLRDWASRGQLGEVEIVTETEDVRQQGIAEIKAHVRPRMRSAHGCLVLVGNNTHDRRWVDLEIDYFLGAGRPIAWLRTPGSSGAPPPRIRHLQEVPWSPESIRRLLQAW